MKWKQTRTDSYQDQNIITKVPSAETQWDLSLWDQSSACRKFPTVHVNSSVQSLSRVQLFATPWTAACQASLSITNSQYLLTHVHWVSDAIQPSHPLSPPSPLVLSLSQHQGLFQWVTSLYPEAKVLELQLQHQSFQWIFRLISFRIDWFGLFAVQGTQESSPALRFESICCLGLS